MEKKPLPSRPLTPDEIHALATAPLPKITTLGNQKTWSGAPPKSTEGFVERALRNHW